MRNEHQANEALAAACAPRRTDWTTPAPKRSRTRIERSHRLADIAMLAILAGSLAGLFVGFFG
jgi:hypothetical protein